MVVPSFVFAPVFVLIAALGGIGNDTLDYVDSATYWRLVGVEQKVDSLMPLVTGEVSAVPDSETIERLVKELGSPDFIKRQSAKAALADAGPDARPFLEKARKSEDPEIAFAAAQVLSRLSDTTGGNRLHRLMAIRTLGEMKVADAVPELEKLSTSEDPFVPEYAARALAEIRGEKYEPEAPDPRTFEKDLAILYPKVAAIFHARSNPRTAPPGIRDQIGQATALAGGIAAMSGKAPKIPKDEALLSQITLEHLTIFRRIGNVRIDSFTAMIPEDFTPDDGGLIVVVRGQCDHGASLKFMEEEFPKIAPAGAAPGLKILRVGGVEWIRQLVLDMDFYVHFPPGGELLIFVGGTRSMMYLESISDRLMGKDKTLAEEPAIDLLKRIPEGATQFAAGEIPGSVVEIGGNYSLFKTFTASLLPDADRKLGLEVRLKGEGEERVSKHTEFLTAAVGIGRGMLQALAKSDERLAGLAETVGTIRMVQDGSALGITAEIDPVDGLPTGLMIGFNSLWSTLSGKPAEGIDLRPAVPDVPIPR